METAGGLNDPSIGDRSRRDWYNRTTGQLYISHFKTQGSAAGRSYDFMLKGDMRKAVDDTLAPGAPMANRKYLVDGGVERLNNDKAGLPLPVGTKIRDAFKKVGFIYMTGKKGSLQPTSPSPLDIRHAKVVVKY